MAHSGRNTSVLAAFDKNASVVDIYKATIWALVSMLIRYYEMDSLVVAEAAFGQQVV